MKEICELTFNNLDYEEKKYEIIEEFNYLKNKINEIYYDENIDDDSEFDLSGISADEYLNLVYKNLNELKIITTKVIKKSYGIED